MFGFLQQPVANGANEHPCAVAPLGYIPVPELPVCIQVPSISNAFFIHICQRRTSSQTAVELCKDSFHQEKKKFLIQRLPVLQQFLFLPVRGACPLALSLVSPSQKGHYSRALILWNIRRKSSSTSSKGLVLNAGLVKISCSGISNSSFIKHLNS